MDYRETAFRTKFEHAAKQLGTVPQQVVSLKLRDNVSGYHEYHELVQVLADQAEAKCTPVEGDMQGKGHLVDNSKAKIIVVEHETGLEILYIAGSIASLLGLVPLVLKCWSAIRGHRGPPHRGGLQRVEVRRLGDDGRLVEEPYDGLASPWNPGVSPTDWVLLSAAGEIEVELRELRNAVQGLTGRVVALERASASVRRAGKPRAAKKRLK